MDKQAAYNTTSDILEVLEECLLSEGPPGVFDVTTTDEHPQSSQIENINGTEFENTDEEDVEGLKIPSDLEESVSDGEDGYELDPFVTPLMDYSSSSGDYEYYTGSSSEESTDNDRTLKKRKKVHRRPIASSTPLYSLAGPSSRADFLHYQEPPVSPQSHSLQGDAPQEDAPQLDAPQLDAPQLVPLPQPAPTLPQRAASPVVPLHQPGQQERATHWVRVYPPEPSIDIKRKFKCSGPSMEPTLFTNDAILTEHVSPKLNKIKKGDIVVARSPTNPRQFICKRVTGVEGDKMCQGFITSVVVPKGHVWLEGDNRNNSSDSRSYGPVPLGLLRARVLCIIWPFSHCTLLTQNNRV